MPYSEFETETFLRTGEHEAELRAEFGDPLYAELAGLAARIDASAPALEAARPIVFILPGIMGSRLSTVTDGVQDLIWIDPLDLIRGGVMKLKLGDGALPVAASGTVLAPYMRMRLRLRIAGYDARFLPYDWRLSPAVSGAALMAFVRHQQLRNVTVVGHSMGGLVARAMAAEDRDGTVLRRVVTVGTPNHGSYSPVEIFALTHGMLGKIGLADIRHTPRDIATDVLRHFPGLLQMMPDPAKRAEEDLFASQGWPAGAVRPLKAALEAARAAIAALPGPDDRFRQIVGYGEKTITSTRRDDTGFVFGFTRDGDGTVPRDLAEMADVPRYYTRGAHGSLCNRGDVISAVIDLIGTDATTRLPRTIPLDGRVALPVEEIGAEALAARRAPDALDPTPDETDYAGDFLSRRMEPTAEEVPPEAPGQTDPGTDRTGYPVALMRDARTRWENSSVERDETERNMSESRPLATETPERLNAYAKRLLTQVEATPSRASPVIVADLKKAIGVIADQGGSPRTLRPTSTAFLERVIGEAEELLSVMFIKRAIVAARSVGRIVSNDTQGGFGTGFLVAPGILMTNQHVLRDASEAKAASIQFLYELEIDSREATGHVFRLEPDRMFYSDETLDFAIVAVAPLSIDGTPLDDFGQLPLVSAEGKIRKGQPVNIVQHPLAGRKQVVFRDSVLSALPTDPDHVAHYTGDTQPGSSGSPVFSDRWEIVALHHSGVAETDAAGRYMTVDNKLWDESADPTGRTIKWIANEGIRISRIMRVIERLPERFETDGLPGSDLVRKVLDVSRRATRSGAFFETELEAMSCPRCFRPRSAPDAPRPPDPLPAAERSHHLPEASAAAAVVTLPLRIKLEIGSLVD